MSPGKINDAKKNNNQVIVVYDSATGEKNVIHEPSNSQSLEFETVEVISRDSISLSAYGCFLNNASVASLVTLSSPMDKIMLYLFLPLLFRFKAS
jgi:hypothetical protein